MRKSYLKRERKGKGWKKRGTKNLEILGLMEELGFSFFFGDLGWGKKKN